MFVASFIVEHIALGVPVAANLFFMKEKINRMSEK